LLCDDFGSQRDCGRSVEAPKLDAISGIVNIPDRYRDLRLEPMRSIGWRAKREATKISGGVPWAGGSGWPPQQ
jgi:hypothetical protein